MAGSLSDLTRMAEGLVKGGVTSFLPSTLSGPLSGIVKAVECVEEAMGKEMKGAGILGVHLEGPFFSMEQKGAQNPEYIIPPRPEDYLPILDKHPSILRVSAVPDIFEIPAQEGNYVAKLADRSAFASSVATMDQLLRVAVRHIGLSVADAVRLITFNPAWMQKIDHERGLFAQGMKADITAFDDDLKIQLTLVEGKIEYQEPSSFY